MTPLAGRRTTGRFVGPSGKEQTTKPKVCPTKTPEPHLLGEFPMTCWNCHVEADS